MNLSVPSSTKPTIADIAVSASAGAVLVTVTGECDQSLADPFTAVLTRVQAARRPVQVDLGGVTSFGSWGVHALLALRAAAPALTVRAASPPVHLALDACGVTLLAPVDLGRGADLDGSCRYA